MSDIVVSGIETVVAAEVTASTSTTTASNLLDTAKQYLYTGGREPRNRLAVAVSSTASTFELVNPVAEIQPGLRLSVDLEDVYVWSATNRVATVQRGQFGSAPASHANDATVIVNPKFSNAEIFRELNNELATLSSPRSGLYRVRTIDLTAGAITHGYDFAGLDVLEVIDVRWDVGFGDEWRLVNGWSWTTDAHTGDFASGKALFITDSITPGATIRVTYRSAFSPLSTLSDPVAAVTGLPVTALDILPLGAAIRLTAGREIRRNFNEVQGDTRRAEEVPPGANLRASLGLSQLHDQRVAAEALRLSAAHPRRRRR